MPLTSRYIETHHNGEKIIFIGRLLDDKHTSILQLYIDYEFQDEVESQPKDGILGCKYLLEGRLTNNSHVTVRLRTHLFMRPTYTIAVDNAKIFHLKGTWGGM